MRPIKVASTNVINALKINLIGRLKGRKYTPTYVATNIVKVINIKSNIIAIRVLLTIYCNRIRFLTLHSNTFAIRLLIFQLLCKI